MSAQDAVQAAVADALRSGAGLAALSVFDAPPVRAGLPYAVIEVPVLADWSTKDWRGREGRVVVVLHDAGERPVRLRALTGLVEDAVEGVDPLLGAGWRVAAMRLVRSRIARGRDERWTATSEFAVRVWRAGV